MKAANCKPERRLSPGTESAGTSSWTFQPPTTVKNKYVLFKSPILWHSVIAVSLKTGSLGSSESRDVAEHPISVSSTELVQSLTESALQL